MKLDELSGLKGRDASKVAIAKAIWKNTSVQMGWIAEELAMKSAANVSQQLRPWAVICLFRLKAKRL